MMKFNQIIKIHKELENIVMNNKINQIYMRV